MTRDRSGRGRVDALGTAKEGERSWFPLLFFSVALLVAAYCGVEPSIASIATVPLFIIVVAVLAVPRGHFQFTPPVWLVAALCGVAALPTLYLLTIFLVGGLGYNLALTVVACAVIGVAVWGPFSSQGPNVILAIAVLLLVATAAVMALAHSARPGDVYMLVSEASKTLVSGHNPYSHVYPNIYSAEDAAKFYGPGVVVADHLSFGYPYLPATLLLALPGYLLSDIRLSGFLASALVAIALVLIRRGIVGRAIAVALLCGPTTVLVALAGWTELGQLALVAAAALSLTKQKYVLGATLLALAFVSKQYFVVGLPAMLLLRPYLTRRHWLVFLGVGVALVLPFILINPLAFKESVVDFHLSQPFRSESTSLLVLAVNSFGWPPPWTYGILPIAVGLGSAGVLAWRLQPGAKAFLFTIAVSLAFTILFSKQAFVNYWTLVAGCLLLAAAVSGPDLAYRVRRPRGAKETDGS